LHALFLLQQDTMQNTTSQFMGISCNDLHVRVKSPIKRFLNQAKGITINEKLDQKNFSPLLVEEKRNKHQS